MIKVNSLVEILQEGCTGSLEVGTIGTVKDVNDEGMVIVVSGATEEIFCIDDLKEVVNEIQTMTDTELLKTIIDLDIRKNNQVKIYFKNNNLRGFRIDNTYTEEADGTFSVIGTVKLINYYWYYEESNRKNNMGWHEAKVFDFSDGRCIESLLAKEIVKIEVIKQNKTGTENPIINQIKKYSDGEKHSFEKTIEIAKALNIL